ncbi:MAG: hypothetical protein SFT91_04550 [Rickettsiaceae bacterium]|nr:hypothetical protein [Rickettsiaceae bacterium]
MSKKNEVPTEEEREIMEAAIKYVEAKTDEQKKASLSEFEAAIKKDSASKSVEDYAEQVVKAEESLEKASNSKKAVQVILKAQKLIAEKRLEMRSAEYSLDEDIPSLAEVLKSNSNRMQTNNRHKNRDKRIKQRGQNFFGKQSQLTGQYMKQELSNTKDLENRIVEGLKKLYSDQKKREYISFMRGSGIPEDKINSLIQRSGLSNVADKDNEVGKDATFSERVQSFGAQISQIFSSWIGSLGSLVGAETNNSTKVYPTTPRESENEPFSQTPDPSETRRNSAISPPPPTPNANRLSSNDLSQENGGNQL